MDNRRGKFSSFNHVDHKYKSIPNPNFYSICLYNMKKCFLKDFVLVGTGIIIDVDDDLSK